MYIGNLYITLSLILVSFPHGQKSKYKLRHFACPSVSVYHDPIIIPFTEAHILLTSGKCWVAGQGFVEWQLRQRDEGSLPPSFSKIPFFNTAVNGNSSDLRDGIWWECCGLAIRQWELFQERSISWEDVNRSQRWICLFFPVVSFSYPTLFDCVLWTGGFISWPSNWNSR